MVKPRLNNSPGKTGKTISGVKDNSEIKDTKDAEALKALERIDKQIINMTIDTGNPVSFLNWTTAKQLVE